jgi:phage terminase small subunit
MEEPEKEVKRTIKEERFCHEFIKDFNATKAAERAKYSKASARQIGSENLSKPYIKKYIAQLLEAVDMEEGEIKKRFSDIARTDMRDYMVKRQVSYTPKIKVGLEALILNIRNAIEFEDDYALEVNLKGDELEAHMKSQEFRRREIIRYKLELTRNPKAYRIVNGETVLIETAELDMVKIIDDKDGGPIKSIKHTKDGIQVEPYSADNALTTLAKFKGMLVDRSEVDMNANVDQVVKIGYGKKEEGA